MSTNVVADPVELAADLNAALIQDNFLWEGFPLWDGYMGKREYHLHKVLSGIAALVAGEEIAYATSTLTLSDEADDCSYEVVVLTERHVVRAHREARQAWPTIRLTSRKDLRSIEVLNAPITTISVHEPLPAGGPFTLRLEYPLFQVDLAAARQGHKRLASLIPSVVADLDA